MAEMKIVRLKLKKELSDDEMEPIKGFMEQKLKTTIRKEKNKGKRLMWFVKARKPDLLTEDNIALAFKRAKMLKMLVLAEVADS